MQKLWRKIKLAAIGVAGVLKRPKYIALALIITAIFIFIFNLFSTGNTYLQLIIHLPFLEKFAAIGQVYVNFGTHILSLDKILILLLSILESVLIVLIIFSKRHGEPVRDNSLLGGGFAALLGVLGAGCPMCGGMILLPILAIFFGVAAYSWLESISLVIVVIAFVPVILSIRKQGFICYTLINAEKIIKEKNESTN